MRLKKYIPNSIKIKVHLLKRGILDWWRGDVFSRLKKNQSKIDFAYFFQIKQDIKLNASTSAKMQNLSQAIKSIETVQIHPNQVFSFWKTVGYPSKKRGFVESRSLINGVLKPSVGGGLCQLSGLIYYICLQAGLKIIERHCHSKDIYTDATRFTPLGSDATVAYGYKDLRVKNNFKFPIKFTFSITSEHLIIRLNSLSEVNPKAVHFKQLPPVNGRVEIVTLIEEVEQCVSSYYI